MSTASNLSPTTIMEDIYLEKAIRYAGEFSAVGVPTAEDWRVLERELNLQFPSDFKRFSTHFGIGTFGVDHYLWSPASPISHLRLSRDRLVQFHSELVEFVLPVPITPDANGGVVVISTTSRIHYVLRPNGRSLSSEIVRLNLSLEEAENYRIPIAEFVTKAYDGTLGSDVRELIWSDSSPFFEPLSG